LRLAWGARPIPLVPASSLSLMVSDCPRWSSSVAALGCRLVAGSSRCSRETVEGISIWSAAVVAALVVLFLRAAPPRRRKSTKAATTAALQMKMSHTAQPPHQEFFPYDTYVYVTCQSWEVETMRRRRIVVAPAQWRLLHFVRGSVRLSWICLDWDAFS